MNLPPLDAKEFPSFFEAIHGYEPFPWQRRLARLVFENGWPKALDVPTGAGKTAAMDVALFHLALEADRGSARRAPLRVAFVVDRRHSCSHGFHVGFRRIRPRSGSHCHPAGRVRSGALDPPRRNVLGMDAHRPPPGVLNCCQARKYARWTTCATRLCAGVAPNDANERHHPARSSAYVASSSRVAPGLPN